MKTSISNFFITAVAVFACFSCSKSPKGESAVVNEAQEVAEVSENAEMYELNTSRSVITWIGSRPAKQHNGTINVSGGQIAVTDGNISGGEITIDIKSLKDKDLSGEDKAKLEGHLMSEDFFHADQYPTATFEIVEVVPFDSTYAIEEKEQFKSKFTPASMKEFMVKDPTHKVTGNLTMRGTIKSVSFPAKISMDENSISAEAKFNIDRTDWNLSYGDEASVVDKAQDKFIYNTVNVGLNLLANKTPQDSL